MKNKIFTLFACLMAASFVFAQEAEKVSPWKFSGLVGLNASATGLVNWTAGGNNNISGLAFGKLNLDYAQDNLAWNTALDMEYGLTWVDQANDKLQKSSDRINFSTKFGYQFADKLYVSAQAAFQSQFANGRKYDGTEAEDPIISKILAPSYTDISVGLDYKPASFFSLYFSPVSGRISTAYISDAYAQKYGIDPQALQESYGIWHYATDPMNAEAFVKVYDNVRAELGLNLKAALNYQYKDLKLMSTIALFTPYKWDKEALYKDADGVFYAVEAEGREFVGYRDNNRRFGRFDVNWDCAISYQFLKCLNVTLSTNLKYINGVMIADKNGENAKERVQFQGVLGLGVGYSF